MVAKSVKPRPAKLSPPRTKTASVEPEDAFVDPLADVPLLDPVTDRFTVQPGDIAFVTVGSIEVVVHPSSEAGKTEPRTPLARQPSERPKDET